MTKYLLLALALFAALAGGWGYIEHQRAEKHELAAKVQKDRADGLAKNVERLEEQAALQRATSLARQQELNRLRKLAEDRQKALNEALKANPDWADDSLPPSVYDAITGPLDATGETGPRVDGERTRAGPTGPVER